MRWFYFACGLLVLAAQTFVAANPLMVVLGLALIGHGIVLDGIEPVEALPDEAYDLEPHDLEQIRRDYWLHAKIDVDEMERRLWLVMNGESPDWIKRVEGPPDPVVEVAAQAGNLTAVRWPSFCEDSFCRASGFYGHTLVSAVGDTVAQCVDCGAWVELDTDAERELR